jgi:hypothetical protein
MGASSVLPSVGKVNQALDLCDRPQGDPDTSTRATYPLSQEPLFKDMSATVTLSAVTVINLTSLIDGPTS